MKTKFTVILIILLSITTLNSPVEAQNVLDGIYQPEHAPVRKPIPYYYLREADVMWSKRLIRMLDLRQKLNLPLYYPRKPYGSMYSLTDLLLWGIENEGITVYDPDAGSLNEPFSVPISLKQIDENLGAKIDTQMVEDPMTGEITQKINKEERRSDQVERYLMREIWYFDKQRSMLQVRIIGLCPIRFYEKEVEGADNFGDASGGGTKDKIMKLVFWAYYPSFRNIFANHVVFNTGNDAEYRTFEDIFSMRRFSSRIYRESNVYENRILESYVKGWDVLLEGERIQNWIRNFEHDLWEY
jgi:gliding motility associated protien GldN